MVIGDEKWVTYDNTVRKRSWSKRGEAAQTVAKPGLTARKALLCICWNWKGIICYEWFPIGQQKRCCVPSGQSRPHTSIVTRQKLWDGRGLGWEVLMHPPYSPNLAPSDYHFFLALQNFLSDKKLGSIEDCENRD
ncbi:histone-lysine N-methyltransferase SETMAR [Trichonephila clavipes]|nr:histone-lysine N-methyltransferase SETMAR [Trichonephila clavipes]